MSQTNTQKELLACPCCGKPTFQAPAKVDDETKHRYLACIISGAPYKQTYNLFDQAVKITVTQLAPQVTDKMIRLGAVTSLEQDKDRKSILSDLLSRLYRLLPVYNISIVTDTSVSDYHVSSVCLQILEKALQPDCTAQQLSEMYARLVDPSVVTSLSAGILDKVLVTHSRTMELLVSSGFDDSFYQGIPHAC